MEEGMPPSPEPAPAQAAIVHAQAVPTSFVLHGGEHEVRVTVADGEQQQLSLEAKNLHTGDSFRKNLGAEDMQSLLSGWPQQLVNIPVFCRFLLDAFGQEAGTVALDPGAAISCVSHEESDEFVADIVLTQGSGYLAATFTVVMHCPLRARATAEDRHQIGLRTLRDDFGRQVEAQKVEFQQQLGVLQRQLELMRLQMNERVFFGVNHSVHVRCAKLVMAGQAGELDCVKKTGLLSPECTGHTAQVRPNNMWHLHTSNCQCKNSCNCSYNRLDLSTFSLQLEDVPSATGVAKALFATDTEYIMPLPSAALRPLQLCQQLEILSVCGPAITDLDFVANLPVLAELSVDASQVRDLAPLATLPSLRKLTLTNLNLEGGGEIDLSPLQRVTTLEVACFKGSAAVANIAPLAKLATLRSLDVTNCARVTDRRAFTANPHVVITPA
jgi:hypothetical protein